MKRRFSAALAALSLIGGLAALNAGSLAARPGVAAQPTLAAQPTFAAQLAFAAQPAPAARPALAARPAAAAQASRADAPAADALDLSAPLPLDPAVTVGELPNGLRYYVRENARPEQRAALWLVVGAGSVDEDDDQLGLAHLAEHMAFNGTAAFPRQALVDYLESIGMKFGPEVNAYTSQNETVYMLQVPTDQPELLATGLQVLEEWAHRVSYEDEEIDKERGVVIEEWRLGRGADERMFDQLLPIMFHGSRYGQRNTIGDPEVLRNAPAETLRRFYRDWYRPDLMAVVAVGDFDGVAVEAMIRERFAGLAGPAAPRPRLAPEVPDHDRTLYGIATDPEASGTSISIFHKHDPSPEATLGDYRALLCGSLAGTMLRERFGELSRLPDPPFSRAFAYDRRLARTRSFFTVTAQVKDTGVARGLETLAEELERVRRHGFTDGELERAKLQALRYAEQAEAEAEKTESQRLARACQIHFLQDGSLLSPAQRLALLRDLLPGITVAYVEAWLEPLAGASRVVLVEAPAREDLAVPGEAELAAILDGVAGRRIEPYVDTTTDAPLVAAPPRPGEIVERAADPELGTFTWTLSNGVRVVLKPTDFKNDEVLLAATSPGGSSLVTDDRAWRRASLAAAIVASSGAGAFDETALRKKLAGRIVGLQPYIGEIEEGLRGRASPRDLETLLQLAYLTLTAPREDADAFRALIERQRTEMQNRSASPEVAFRDTLTVVKTCHHQRRLPLTAAELDSMDLAASLAVFRDRFGDCSDFTFTLVGALDPDTVEPLVRTWLGGLPAAGRRESWRDDGTCVPRGIQLRTLHLGSEPKSLVELSFTGEQPWTWEGSFAMDALVEVLRIRLREKIREDKSGTYGVRVSGGLAKIPAGRHQLNIGWGCDPARVEELTDAVWAELRDVAANGPDAETLAKVKATELREDEVALKTNAHWLGQLVRHQTLGTDPHLILRRPEQVGGLSAEAIREAARRVVDEKNHVRVVLMPKEAS